MFGICMPNKEQLSEADKKTYEAYYCGLCRALREKFGKRSTIVLQYDCVFLALLRNGLYENEETTEALFCGHKMRKMPFVTESGLSYAADMNLLLAYWNYKDRVHDGKKRNVRLYAAEKAVAGLEADFANTEAKYPEKNRAIKRYVEELAAYEDKAEAVNHEAFVSPDEPAYMTGDMLAEIFIEKQDEYAGYLRDLARNLGAFIYLSDAFQDLEKDLKSGDYNPYKALADSQELTETVRRELTLLAGHAAEAFEMLPIFRHREILRNILYSGIWANFENAAKKREKTLKGAQTK